MESTKAYIELSQTLTPKLKDLALIVKIYGIYCEVAERYGFKADKVSDNNKQFLFLILWLYSPASLCGGKITKTLRKAISQPLGIEFDNTIYKIRSKALSWYDIYPEFRKECNIAIDEVCKVMADL